METEEDLLGQIKDLEDTVSTLTNELEERDKRIEELEALLDFGKVSAESAQSELQEFLDAIRWEI